jgi:hypothetical protein
LPSKLGWIRDVLLTVSPRRLETPDPSLAPRTMGVAILSRPANFVKKAKKLGSLAPAEAPEIRSSPMHPDGPDAMMGPVASPSAARSARVDHSDDFLKFIHKTARARLGWARGS